MSQLRNRASCRLAVVLCIALSGAVARSATTAAPAQESRDLAQLGRKLFFDPRLSASGRLACASCHDPQFGYGPRPGSAIATGGKDQAQQGTRAIPSLRYLRGSPPFALAHHFIDGDIAPIGGFTWDGRAASIAEQARLPLLAGNEMANASPAELIGRLRKTEYVAEFRTVFGADLFAQPDRAFAGILQALDAFQATPSEFSPYSSRYDAFLRGELDLEPDEERGVALFKDPAKGNCASCHVVTSHADKPPAFTDYDYANVGVPRNPRIAANADPRYFDLGLCGPLRKDLAGRQEYCGMFRAPSLRNVAIRDAFFHNGVFGSLRQVLEFYVERDLYPEKYYARNADGSVHVFDDMPPGFPSNVDRDPPLDRAPGAAPALTAADIDDLIAFLKTLTDADLEPARGARTTSAASP